MSQASPQTVLLFRAIDETSTVIIGTEIKKALDQLSPSHTIYKLFTVPRLKLPMTFRFNLAHQPISSDALNTYFARLIYYPFIARFKRADVYHITDDYYGGIVRVLDPQRCIVSVNHGVPEIYRDELGVGTGIHYRVQRYVFNSITRAAFIVTATNFIREYILSHYPLSPERVVCNPYGYAAIFHPRSVDTYRQTREKFKIAPDWFALMHVGNCGPNKNVEAILHALAQLPEQVHFIQVGGTWSPSQNALIQELQIGARVHALGFFKHADPNLAELYCAANAFVFPSLLEGFGLPLLEAMASGLPTLTSNFGSMAEVGGNGAWRVDPRKPEELANAILGLYKSSDSQRYWQKAALRRAQDFSWRKHAEILNELYQDIYTATGHH